MPQENLEALEWPDLISETPHVRALLNHKIFVRREDFDQGWGQIALLLLVLSGRHHVSPADVRKYVFEIEVID
jgi:hypothetical protein